MLLGGTVAGKWNSPEKWERLLAASRFKAVTAPFSCRTPHAETAAYVAAAKRQGAVIAEVGVWNNLFDPDPEKAAAARDYGAGQLALADEWGIPCCVNIAGTESTAGWDAADRSNFRPETYERIVNSVRDLIDSVKPKRTFYCLEPMPWMVPDGPEEYLRLIRDVDREHFGAHMDFVNMINCPRRFLDAEGFIEECFRLLGPHIRSTHLKDIRLHPTRLTTILEECSPGEGDLDFGRVLTAMDRLLPPEAPVLLEHMRSFREYARAYDFVSEQAARVGVSL